ncbi:MAG: GNAT family N-acetyltransferase [Chloroflexi bacterium]|nr:GNAT family N-acetyltransferase [Chloroflexota bacterium]
MPADLFKPPPNAPDDLGFRLAHPDDFQLLRDACYPEKSLIQFRSQFDHLLDWQENGRCYWLIGINKINQIIASGQLVLYPHGAELANLSVVPTRRGEGIGAALVEALTAVARHLNLSSLEIGVEINNRRALALYQRLGFAEDRRVRIPDAEPAIILHKDL